MANFIHSFQSILMAGLFSTFVLISHACVVLDTEVSDCNNCHTKTKDDGSMEPGRLQHGLEEHPLPFIQDVVPLAFLNLIVLGSISCLPYYRSRREVHLSGRVHRRDLFLSFVYFIWLFLRLYVARLFERRTKKKKSRRKYISDSLQFPGVLLLHTCLLPACLSHLPCKRSAEWLQLVWRKASVPSMLCSELDIDPRLEGEGFLVRCFSAR